MWVHQEPSSLPPSSSNTPHQSLADCYSPLAHSTAWIHLRGSIQFDAPHPFSMFHLPPSCCSLQLEQYPSSPPLPPLNQSLPLASALHSPCLELPLTHSRNQRQHHTRSVFPAVSPLSLALSTAVISFHLLFLMML